MKSKFSTFILAFLLCQFFSVQAQEDIISSKAPVLIDKTEYTVNDQTDQPLCDLKRIYVNPRAMFGNNDGTSWQDAYRDLNTALACARTGATIWVAAGTYSPTITKVGRNSTFRFTKNVTLLGGFVGTESHASERRPDVFKTVLSGDVNGDDVTGDLNTNRQDNLHTILTITEAVSSKTLIDGFIISGGHADGFGRIESSSRNGGGMVCNGKARISNCIFVDNFATLRGGALLLHRNSSGAVLEYCKFINNNGNAGGGVYSLSADVQIKACLFENNRTHSNHFEAHGGGLYLENANGKVANCQFINNFSVQSGAGIFGWSAPQVSNKNLQIVNCQFKFNKAHSNGGAMYLNSWGDSTHYEVKQCQFSYNFTNQSGTVAMYGNGSGTLSISDCNWIKNRATHSSGLEIGSGLNSGFFEYLINNCQMIKNEAESFSGGLTLQSESNARFNIEHCELRDNIAGEGGGGILVAVNDILTSISANYLTITGNQSANGAAIYGLPFRMQTTTSKSSFLFDNCLVTKNTGKNGTITLKNSGRFNLRNTTIADNLANGIVIDHNSALTLHNTVLANPGFTELKYPTSNKLFSSLGGNLILDNSLGRRATKKDFTQTEPGFIRNSYIPAPGSPLINTGYNKWIRAKRDMVGKPRIQQDWIDIGAYETNYLLARTRSLTAENLQLYPNPASNFINIQLPESSRAAHQISIIDANGIIVRQQCAKETSTFDIQDLSAGVYIIKVTTDDLNHLGHFIKQ